MSAVSEVSSPWTRHTKMFYCLPDTVDPRGPKARGWPAIPGSAPTGWCETSGSEA